MSAEVFNETELLRACTKGDTVAFAGIVERYQSLVCALTFSATGDVAQSEELAQQTFVQAWQNLGQLRDLGKFRAWLSSIARNTVRNWYRSKKRDILSKAVPIDKTEVTAGGEPESTEAAITEERLAVVREALERIPPKYREPLVLFYREGQSVNEVAEQLGLSSTAVRQRLHRGRKLMKGQVAAMVESTISHTGPSKAFATAVMASVAGLVVKGSAVAAVGGVVTTTSTAAAGGAVGASTIVGGITAKIVALAAVAVIGVAGVVTYKQIAKPEREKDPAPAVTTFQEQEEDRAKEMPDNEEALVGVPGWSVSAKEATQATEATADRGGEEKRIGVTDDVNRGVTGEAADPPTIVEDDGDSVSKVVSSGDIVFEFVPRGVLSGVITDANTLEPIENVRIGIYCYDHGEGHSAETDVNGMYFFESIEKDGSYRISLETNDYVTLDRWQTPREEVQLAGDAQFVKHFQLDKGCEIRIEVVDEYGAPIRGVGFRAAYVSDEMGRDAKNTVRSDGQGHVFIGGLKPEEYMVGAMHRDYALAGQEVTFAKAGEIKSIVFEMKDGISVEGRAMCKDGLPASGWEVYAKPIWWHSVRVAYSYVIDEDGYFVLEHVVPDDYWVGINLPRDGGSSGLWSMRTTLTLPPENGFLEVNIPKFSPHTRVSISGTIVFTDGEPSRGFWVSARDDSGNRGTTHVKRGETDFRIDSLVPGLYTMDINIGMRHRFRNIRAPSEGVILEIPLKKEVTLTGRVVDKESGEAITQYGIKTTRERSWQEVNNEKGSFVIKVPDEHCQRIQVRSDGYATTIQEICGDANDPAIIELGIGGAIEGIVVDEAGEPIEGAGIGYRYKGKSDEEYITSTDLDGLFVIEEIPEGSTQNWFVINHPNYAPEVKLIEVEEGYLTEVEIVLKKGGVIEGYVYDQRGNPLPSTTLYFLDESSYGYWKQNRGRLGSATTDSNGYYRIAGMPKKLCFGFRKDPDEQLGIVKTAVLPGNGKAARLDFGGKWYVTGRLWQDGQPKVNVRVMIRGNAVAHETTFTAYAVTDSEGRFTFWGIPSGRRLLYWSVRGMLGLEQWVAMGRFDFISGVDLDLEDFEIELAEVTVLVVAEDANEPLGRLDAYIQEYGDETFYGRKVGQRLPRAEPNAPYVFAYIPAGVYEVIARRGGYPTVRKVFEIEKGQEERKIDLWISAGSASLSGKILPRDPKHLQSPLMLRSTSQELTMMIQSRTDGSYRINNLPSGDYIIGRASVALSRQSTITELSLARGEQKSLDIEVGSLSINYDGYLVVMVLTEEGLPLAGTKVWLEKDGETIHPLFDSDKSKSFGADAGEYVLYAECPGYRDLWQTVRIKSREGLNTQEILEPLVITMSR